MSQVVYIEDQERRINASLEELLKGCTSPFWGLDS